MKNTERHRALLLQADVLKVREFQAFTEIREVELVSETAFAFLASFSGEPERVLAKSLCRRSRAGYHLFVATWKLKELDWLPQPVYSRHGNR